MRMHSYINVVNYPKNTVKPMNQNLGTLRILSENKQGERLLTKPLWLGFETLFMFFAIIVML